MVKYSRVVIEVDVICNRCRMEIPAGTLVHYDGAHHRHIQCGAPSKDSFEARNKPRRKVYIGDIV